MQTVKTKVVVAYEPDSSSTTRLTPIDIGELLATMKPSQLRECMDKFTHDVRIFRGLNKSELNNELCRATLELRQN